MGVDPNLSAHFASLALEYHHNEKAKELKQGQHEQVSTLPSLIGQSNLYANVAVPTPFSIVTPDTTATTSPEVSIVPTSTVADADANGPLTLKSDTATSVVSNHDASSAKVQHVNLNPHSRASPHDNPPARQDILFDFHRRPPSPFVALQSSPPPLEGVPRFPSQTPVREMPPGPSPILSTTAAGQLLRSLSKKVDSSRAEVVGDYILLKPSIGEGKYGMVFGSSHSESKLKYAMKRIVKSAHDSVAIYEAALLKKLKHKNIVTLHEFLETKNYYYLVLDLCDGVLVKQNRASGAAETTFLEAQCRTIFRQLVLGIEYLHGQGAVHRDIKPENLLFFREKGSEEKILKIADFGISKVFSDGEAMNVGSKCGTLAFLAPELVHCDGRTEYDGPATDIFSMGVTLYVIFHGVPPFSGGAGGILDYKNGRRDDPEETPMLFMDLINRMLDLDPNTRITMDEIRIHPWLTNREQDPLISKERNVGSKVEVSEEDQKNAVQKHRLRQVTVVVRAVNKFKEKARTRNLSLAMEEGFQTLIPPAAPTPAPTTEYAASTETAMTTESSENEPRDGDGGNAQDPSVTDGFLTTGLSDYDFVVVKSRGTTATTCETIDARAALDNNDHVGGDGSGDAAPELDCWEEDEWDIE
ncbi:hypothetical protein BGZ83_007715 [Gryganskiella cystojenkinii]|nr:hypothetical protein BGZ83_007715 [Gryganskiella cystojenkinii]